MCPGATRTSSRFCPGITSVALARQVGVSYILEPPTQAGPPGTSLVATLAGERLYRVPDVHEATAVPLGRPGAPPPTVSAAVPVSHPDPATWSMTVHSATTVALQLRITDVPGWHATIDGRPLALSSWDGVLLQTYVPAGTHRVVVRYRPTTFDLGLVLATVGLASVAVVALLGPVRRVRGRGGPTRPVSPGRVRASSTTAGWSGGRPPAAAAPRPGRGRRRRRRSG